MTLAIVFLTLLALIFLGAPILLAIGAASLAGILIVPELVTAMFPQRLFSILDSFSLLAMPFFILAGSIMSVGGMSRRLVEFADAAVGHLRGGLAQSNIVASMVFAGVSGSSTADTAAIGSILIPSMKERGFSPGYAAAITATSSTIGPIIPPSMVMIIYGSMAGVSIGGMFLAGIIPGLLIGIGLMVCVYVQSFIPSFAVLRAKFGKFSLRRVVDSTRRVWTALVAPIIIIGGIISGVFTATEAGVVTVVYAFVTTYFVYRSFPLRDMPKIVLDAAITTCQVVGVISVAGALGWLLTYLSFNRTMLGVLQSVSTNPHVVFGLMLAMMLVLTMFIESLAVMIIFVPVAVYVSQAFGFDPYHAGVAVVMATQIGATTPPVAVLLFVSTSIARTSYDETVRHVWPFLITLLAVLLLVVLIPPLTTFIPVRLLGY
jgi:tripartite ATP-independent transporter DctM subunit